jgi:hypothetical protein
MESAVVMKKSAETLMLAFARDGESVMSVCHEGPRGVPGIARGNAGH